MTSRRSGLCLLGASVLATPLRADAQNARQPKRIGHLALDMRTAKALGLTIPQTILVRADRVIE